MKNFLNYENWSKTNRIYSDWLIKTDLRKVFNAKIKFKNFSLWWACNLVNKDNINNKEWYINLHYHINKKKIIYKNNYFYLFFKLLVKFIASIFFLFFIKTFFKEKKKYNSYNYCFHSDDINLISFKNHVIDRQYGFLSLKKKSCFLIKLHFSSKIFFKYTDYKKKFLKISKDYYIQNKYISLSELIYVYLFSFLMFVKLIFYIRKKYFKYRNLDLSPVLLPHLLKSFFGEIQDNLIDGISIKNFFKKKKVKWYLNYNEFYPGARTVYYFIKDLKIYRPGIATINHANFSNNEIFFSLNKKEFYFKDQGTLYSPVPDIYLVQGEKYFSKLKKTIPFIKIYKVGSLKIELNYKKSKKIKKLNSFSYKKKIISIWTSLNDYGYIIPFLNNINHNNYYFILRPHPVVFNETILEFKKNCKIKFKCFSNLANQSILQISDFVLFDYGSIGFESIIYKRKVLRIYNNDSPPAFDVNDNIPLVTNSILLEKYLSEDIFYKKVNKKKIIDNFFYKFDKFASKRINKILN
jgi:hypothetical protein